MNICKSEKRNGMLVGPRAAAALVWAGLLLLIGLLGLETSVQAQSFSFTNWKTNEAGQIVSTNGTSGFARVTGFVPPNVTVIVETVPPDPQFVSLFLATGYIMDGSDLAQPDSDYTPVSVSVAGGNSGVLFSIAIPLINDTAVEFNEDILVRMRAPTVAANNSSSVDITTVTIEHDDPPAGAVDLLFSQDPPYDDANFNPGANSFVQAVTETFIDGQRKIYIAGDFTSVNTVPNLKRIARLNNDGSVDTTFNIGDGADAFVNAIAVQPDGKVVIGGGFGSVNSAARSGIARLLTNGVVDASFNPGIGAKVGNDVGAVRTLAIYTNGIHAGKIIVGGDFSAYNGTNRGSIVRLNPDGSLDSTFSTGGGADGPVYSAKIQADGKVVIGGDFTHVDGVARSRVARLTLKGDLDETFNPGTGADNTVFSVAFDRSSPAIVVNRQAAGGSAEDRFILSAQGTSGVLTINYDFLVVPDTLTVYYPPQAQGGVVIFATGLTNGANSVSIPFSGSSTNLEIVVNEGSGQFGTLWFYDAILTGPAGAEKILIGGAFSSVDLRSRNRIARLTADGSLDTTYNPGSGFNDIVYAIDLEPLTGKAIVGGLFTSYNSTARTNLARLFPNGSLDTSFMDTAYNQNAGPTNSSFFVQSFINALAVQTDGNIVIGGAFNGIGGDIGRQGNGTDVDGRLFIGSSLGATWPALETSPFDFQGAGRSRQTGGTGGTRWGVRTRSNFARVIGGITPNDLGQPGGPGQMEFLSPVYAVNEFGTNAVLTIRRTNGTLGTIAISFATSNLTATAGPPGVGDYASTNDSRTWFSRYRFEGLEIFSSGDPTNKNFRVSAFDDLLVEGNEDVLLKMFNPVGFQVLPDTNVFGGFFVSRTVSNIVLGAAIGFQGESILTIVDDDFSFGVFNFSTTNYVVNENAGVATITVTRTGGSVGSVSVKYSTVSGGTAKDSPPDEQDYTVVTNTLAFGPGQISRTFTVPIINDARVEFDETIQLILANPTGGATLGAVTNATLTIYDNDNGFGSLSFTTNSYTVAENGLNASVTVQRTSGSAGTVTVLFQATDGDAPNGAVDTVHFMAVSTNLSFGNGETSQTVLIPIIDDPTPNVDRTVNLKLSVPGGGAQLGGQTNAVLAIVNEDFYGNLSFSSLGYFIGERDTNAIITVIRTGGSSGTVSVDFNTANGTGFSGLDFTNATGTLTFAPGQVAASFTVGIINDSLLESDETVGLSLFNFVNATPAAATNAVLTIADDESLNFPAGTDDTGFSPSPGPNSFVFSLAVQPDRKLLVGGAFTFFNGTSRNRIARVDGTGALDTGFTPGAGANDTVRSVVLQPDGRVLIGGQFTVFNGTNRNYIARLKVDGTLDVTFDPGAGADNPVLALALNTNGTVFIGGDFTVVGGFARNRIALLNTNGALVTAFNPGTGANNTVRAAAIHTNGTHLGKVVIGGDFTTVNGVPNNRIARLNLTDGSVDANFSAALGSGVTNGIVYAIAIQNDEKIVVGGVFTNIGGVARTNIARLNADGSVDATFNPGTGPNNAVYALVLQPDGKIIIAGEFTSVAGVGRNRIARLNTDGTVDPTINFGSGANNFIATLALRPDQRIILGGGFTQFSGVARNYLEQVIGGATAGAGTLQFSSASYSTDETSASALITVTRLGGTEGAVSVDFATVAGGSAVSGADYTSTNSTLFFASGETGQTFTVPLLNDTVVDGNKTVSLRLSNAINAGVPDNSLLGARTNATLTILDDDSVVGFSAASYSISEGGGAANITVVRNGGTVGPVSVRVFTTDGTATASLDYTGVTNTLSFGAGENSKTFAVPILEDNLVEGNETITLTLTNLTGAAVLDLVSSVTLTIVDNDLRPGVLNFSTATYGVNENNGVALIGVVRTNGSSGTITVNFATSDGTATNGVFPAGDYTATNGSLTFADGETLKTFSVPIHPDFDSSETNETVVLLLNSPTGGASLGSQFLSVLTITNNNDFIFGSLRFSTNAYSINENGANATIEVWLVGRTTNTPITVTYATANGTATAGLDYSGVTNTLVFAAGETNKTFTVPVINEFPLLAEGDETVLLTLAEPVGGAGLIAPFTATLTIVDDDFLAGSFTFLTNNFATNEISTNATITVLRTNGSTGTVTVDFLTSEGTARNGVDYTDTSGTLTFTNGVSSQTFLIPLIHNPLQRGNFTVNLALRNATAGALISQSSAVLTILDNEPAAGSEDPTFVTGLGADNTIYSLALRQATGKLLIGGDFTRFDGAIRTNIARVNADGTLDGAFASGSLNMSGGSASVRAVAVYTNGLQIDKVVIGGMFTTLDGTNRNFVARLNTDGTLDSTFNPGLGANNVINAVLVQNDGRVVVGGAFTAINGTNRNFIARLNEDGSVDDTFNPGSGADAPVRALAADANGLILVGGDFAAIGDVVAGRIARLKADGSVDKTFDPGLGANGPVRAIVVQNNSQIVIGGEFTAVDGTNSFNRIARLTATGALDTSFMGAVTGEKGMNDFVSAIAVQPDNKLLLGGGFTSVNGTTNVNRITRLDANGNLDPTFNPGGGANNFVSALALQTDGKIVVVGAFTAFNGATHNRIVRLHGGENVGIGNLSFTASAFTVNENGLSAVIAVERTRGTTNRVSVDYATANGSAVAYPGSGSVDGFHYTNSFGTLIFEQGDTLKTFLVPIIDNTNVFGNTLLNLSLFNATNYAVGVGTNRSDSLLGTVTNATLTIIEDDGVIGFAAASFNVNEDASLATVTVLRAGGVTRQASVDFFTADDVTNSRPASAGFDYTAVTNTLTFFPGQTSASVSIPIINDTLVEGNETVKLTLSNPTNVVLGLTAATLSIIDDEFRPGVLLFSATDFTYSEGVTNAVITVIRTNGTTGAVSVDYGTSDGSAQAGLDYNSVTNTLSFADGQSMKTFVVPIIDDSAVDGNELETVNLFLGNPGGGATLAGSGSFGALDATFNLGSGPDNTLNAVALQLGGQIVIGGSFTAVDGVSANRIARLNVNGSIDTTFDPGFGANNTVLALAVDFNGTNFGKVWLGGNFTAINTNALNRVARLNVDGSLDTNFNIGAGANNTIRALAIHTSGTNAGKAVVAGDFSSVSGAVRNRLVRLNPDGSLDPAFNVGAGFNGTINAVAIQSSDNSVVVGGTFTTFNTTNAFRIARLLADGTFDTTFTANAGLGPNAAVNAIAIQSDGKIVLAGAFSSIDGSSRNFIARLLDDGTLDGTFDPGAGPNAAINTVAVQPDGAIIIGGGFGTVSGVSRNGIDRLTATGARDSTFDPGAGANAVVNAVILQPDTKILIGGAFTMFNGTPKNRIARLEAGAALGLALATLTIVDNDIAIGFSTNDFQVGESALTQTVTVTRSGLSNLTFVVDFATLDGTGSGAAFGGLDYIPTNGSLTFGPNETNKTFEVALLSDSVVEGNEFFNLRLTGTGGANLTGLTNATLTILDDDTAFDLGVGISVMEPVYVGSNYVYTILVTNFGPSSVTGVTFSNALPAGVLFTGQTNSLGLGHVLTGNLLTFDLGTLTNGAVAAFTIFNTATNPVSGLVTTLATILPISLGTNATDANTNNNIATNVLLIRDPSPFIAANRALTTVTNESLLPANGAIDPGETVTLNLALQNIGNQNTAGSIVATLLATNGVISPSGAKTYGALSMGQAAVQSFTFTANGTNGQTIVATLQLTDNGVFLSNNVVLVPFTLGASTNFANTSTITIPDAGAALQPNYPSTITVSNLNGIVGKVTVTLNGLSHSYPADLDILLVSPWGEKVVIMSDAGGGLGNGVTNVTLTLDDEAAVVLPSSSKLTNGTYRPFNYNTDQNLDNFALPAPASPYETNLAAFNGINPNGVWSLYVTDDSIIDPGTLLGGWSLTITAINPVSPTVGLALSMSSATNSVFVGDTVIYTLMVTNIGPDTATSVTITNTLPAGVSFVTATNGLGTSFAAVGNKVVFTVGALPTNQVSTNYLVVIPRVSGTLVNQAIVSTPETDPFPPNNAASVSITVVPSADLLVSQGVASSIAFGANLTNVITVRNLGPSTATSIILTSTFPASATFVSSAASQGAVSAPVGNVVTASLGNLASNAIAIVTLVSRPNSVGNVTNTASVGSPVFDVSTTNNSVSAVTTVGASADLAVAITSSPNPVVVTSNLTYTITVTNRGLSVSTNVVVTDTLPGSLSFVSVSSSQGSAANLGGTVTCNLGDLATGVVATVTIQVKPTATGPVNNTVFVTAATSDPDAANNSATVIATVNNRSVEIVVAGSTLVGESNGVVNGAIDPGETVTIAFGLRNKGGTDTTNLVATLLGTGGVITNIPQAQSYGVLTAGGSSKATNFTFTASGSYGDTVSASFQLQEISGGTTNNLGTVIFPFTLGVVNTFSNTTQILLLDNSQAAPYPSAITVTNLAGTIIKVSVTLSNLTHNFPDDMDILLESPSGQSMLLMSDAGGGFGVGNLTLTFDDAAGSFLPDAAPNGVTNGTYKPSNFLNVSGNPATTNDTFVAPAPQPAAGTLYATSLSAFNGTNPNGAWKLYAVDDSSDEGSPVGVIADGWLLRIISVATLNPSVDVAITLTNSPTPAQVASNLTYTAIVNNNGPNTATNVVLTNFLPASVGFVSATASQGSFASGGGLVTFNLGTLLSGAKATNTIIVSPTVIGDITLTSVVSSAQIELISANNTAANTVNVINLPVDLAFSMTGAPNPVSVSSNVTFSLVVTNLGTNSAIGVKVTNALASGVSFVSATAGQGTSASSGGLVTFDLGTLTNGANITNLIVVRANLVGSFTNSALVAIPTQTETNLVNNVAVVVITVDGVQFNAASSGVTTNGGFELNLLGHTNKTYVIEVSTNLVTWTPIFTNSTLTGTLNFIDTNAPNFTSRFYRALEK